MNRADGRSGLGCRFCGAPLSHVFVDLGASPLANSYLEPEDLGKAEPFYPLCVYVCDRCFLVQLPEEEKAEAIFSDYAYFSSYSESWLRHAETYARGNVHTNGMENYWSLLKRGLGGTYVSVEPFHLFRYLDEQAFRFNERKRTDQQRFGTVIDQIVGKRLMYKDLIGATNAPNLP